MNQKPDTTPMDAADLLPCAQCGNGMMHSGAPVFYEVTIRQCVVDLPNVKRMHGMELMMGGAVGLARALSPNNTVAHRLGQPTRRAGAPIILRVVGAAHPPVMLEVGEVPA